MLIDRDEPFYKHLVPMALIITPRISGAASGTDETLRNSPRTLHWMRLLGSISESVHILILKLVLRLLPNLSLVLPLPFSWLRKPPS